MKRDEPGDLAAFLATFLAVIEAGSFTNAARLGIRLLDRTARPLGPAEAGTQLAAILRPCFDEIARWIAALSAMGGTPAGLVRITFSALAAEMILWPVTLLLPDYPDVKIEVTVESRFTDIATEGFDASEPCVTDDLAHGHLVRALEDWCLVFAGFHL